ncbi:hypothetical protein TBR22_A49940 [Luteitalea sp. TBR-22]|uniref:hypothetical protein n=1 Tax=Luteitalea sp. TBR-22 TaxID=2802971 RepID=UPI001AF59F7B|nr:hypothetical protein [Luteitalea sp. TBR-22]BCS35760.1 hypothetical protein TBR22_A49940 [Luteitalea sp. TBR-22]
MHDDPCPREPEVLRAVEEGRWPADLRAHAEACQACREVETVTAALREVVDAEAALPMPAAGDVWWRAAWQARREARARALRPLDTLERSEPLVAMVALVILLVARGDLVLHAAARWLSLDGGGQALAAVLPAAVLPFLLIGLGLGGVVILVGLGAVVAND